MKKYVSYILLVCLCAILMLTGCGSKEAAAITVDKDEIGVSEAVFYTRLNQQQWEQAYVEALGTEFWTQTLNEELGTFADELKRQVMDTLLRIHIMNDHAKEYGVELTKEEKANVESRVKDFMESHTSQVKEAAGADEKLVEELLTQNVIADKVAEAMTAGYIPVVSEEEAVLGKMTYCLFSTLGTYTVDGNHTRVTAEERERIAEEAQVFADRAGDIGDLVAAADEIGHASVDVYFNEFTNGGAHEWMAEALRSMDEGQISGPLETEEGYYVFQYVSAYDETATEENRERLYQAKVEEYRQELYETWYSQAVIEIHWEVWDEILVDQVLFVP